MPTKSNGRLLFAMIFVLVSTLASCATTNHDTATGWNELKELYQVKGKQGFVQSRTVGFGPYHSSTIQFNPHRTKHQWEIIPVRSVGMGLREISFKMAGNWGTTAEVYCVNGVPFRRFASSRKRPVFYDLMKPVVNDPYKGEIFGVEIIKGGEEHCWKMMIASNLVLNKNKRIAGYLLRDADNYYSILPVIRYAKTKESGNPWKLSGYEFKNRANQLVAEISLVNKGSVTLGHVTEAEKFLLANACAAILVNYFAQSNLQSRP